MPINFLREALAGELNVCDRNPSSVASAVNAISSLSFIKIYPGPFSSLIRYKPSSKALLLIVTFPFSNTDVSITSGGC